MMIRMISLDFGGISNDLPDVSDVTHLRIQKSPPQNFDRKIDFHHENRFFSFAPETFLGHLGGAG